MGDHHNHKHQTTLECVDEDPEYIPGEVENKNGGLFYFTRSVCNQGLQCPPYHVSKAITCVICTQ